MKVLQVVHGYLPQFRGGTELYLHRLNRRLRADGHEVEIVTGTTHVAEEAHVEDYFHEGFRVWKIVLSGSYLEHWTRSLSPDATAQFTEVLRKTRPDIVHVHHWYRLSRDLIETCFRMGIPAVCTLHDMWTSCPRIFRIREESFCGAELSAKNCTSCVPRFPWMDDESTASQISQFKSDFSNELRLADRIIVPSKAHGDVLQSLGDVPSDRVKVLPHGTIVSDSLSRDSSAAVPTRSGPIRLGIWGHLFHMKGAHLVLEALQKVEDPAAFHLDVWGEVVEPHYQARLDELSDGLDITWHGAFVPKDVAKHTLDLAIIPSLCSESFSFVLDEAFKMGVPAVVSNRGALAERIGEAGTTFEAESSASLAEVLNRLVRDPSSLDRWAAGIEPLRSMAHHAGELTQIYTDVVAGQYASLRKPDPTMLDQRARLLSSLNRQAEGLMFGYLGHIKRETGRGNHYEGVVNELIDDQNKNGQRLAEVQSELDQIQSSTSESELFIDALTEEISELRRALHAVHSKQQLQPLSTPESLPETSRHLIGLGSLRTVVEENRRIIADYFSVLNDQRKNKSETQETSQRVIDDLNAVEDQLAETTDELENQKAVVLKLRGTLRREKERSRERLNQEVNQVELYSQDLKNLQNKMDGMVSADDLETLNIRATEAEAANGLTQRALLATGGMVDSLRKVLLKIRDRRPEWRDSSFGLSKDVADIVVQDLGPLSEAIDRNKDLIESFFGAVRELHDRGEAVEETDKIRHELEQSTVLVNELAGMVEYLRLALVAVFADEPNVATERAPMPDVGAHIPGLGDLATTHSVNDDLIARYLDRIREFQSMMPEVQDDSPVEAPAAEVEPAGADDVEGESDGVETDEPPPAP